MLRALIFDFDGTILDTESADFESWQDIYREHNCSLTLESWSLCVGTTYHAFNPYDHLEQQLGKSVDRDRIAAEHHRRVVAAVEQKELLAGVRELIGEARKAGLQLAVASSSPRTWVQGHLERHGIAADFDVIRTADDVRNVKPDPELYQAVLNTLGRQACEAIAFEDSPNGARAAKAAGIYCIAVPNPVTCTLPLDHADDRIDCLKGVTLESLRAKLSGC